VRWLRRTLVGIVALAAALLVGVLVASYVFNLITDGEGRPVTSLWHGRFVEADGVLTAYRAWGTHGSPIVLIGGFLEPSFVWDGVGPRLADAGHRVYALDLDGFGFSQRRGPWTLAEWADQVQGFMRALEIRDPVAVGHSLGAAVAVELARRGSASRAVLLDGDALRTGGPPRLVGRILSHLPLATSAVRLSTDWDWPVEEILGRAYGPHHPTIDHRLAALWTAQFRADGAGHALTELLGNGVQGFSSAQLRALRIRATVVWGSRDGVDPVGAGRQTARDLGARFVLIPGFGHLDLLTDPGAVARAIEAA
jgi:pimeloyl-ACP methyl ester carboxylesterase